MEDFKKTCLRNKAHRQCVEAMSAYEDAEKNPNTDPEVLAELKTKAKRAETYVTRLRTEHANATELEARRWHLASQLAYGLVVGEGEMTPEQVADTAVTVADAVISRLYKEQE